MYIVRKYDHFVKFFREIITALTVFELSLVVIPYPGGVNSNKGCPFTNEATTVSSSYKSQI